MKTPLQANSREELRAMLASRESGGIIFTTVQKFSLLSDEDEHPRLCERSNVVVISDEAHRSQYGLKARLKQIKDKETGEVTGAKYVFGYAKHMRDALPQASFIGFTGTPIDTIRERQGASRRFVAAGTMLICQTISTSR